MNRLRKRRPGEPTTVTANGPDASAMSRTMQLAVSGNDDSSGVSMNLRHKAPSFPAPLAAAPRTKVEQYWATRALVVETLLSARDRHQAELAEVRRMEERKREREIGAILHANDQRQRRLERLMATCLVVTLGFVIWLVINITPDRDAKNKPAHFTIPILSPFTSVVEHETGVFGAKAVVAFVVVVGVAVYAASKRWLAQWRSR